MDYQKKVEAERDWRDETRRAVERGLAEAESIGRRLRCKRMGAVAERLSTKHYQSLILAARAVVDALPPGDPDLIAFILRQAASMLENGGPLEGQPGRRWSPAR